MGDGIVTLWKPINAYEDQISRIKINKMESVDCIISAMDSDARFMYSGCSNGGVSKLDVKAGKVVENRLHDSSDEVGLLDLDYQYRLVSAGMEKLNIWSNDGAGDEDEDEADDGEPQRRSC
ncbi:unnamed protein product [Ambrosiozyma monospora]|uniref:Unnamed protein product n=1 Tax=Ambrosiozyma monospora TaxID=43982 RepID=A0ACB5U835_AMBMO|nr:unnamed protein product [Ambrosiozyma monospora]